MALSPFRAPLVFFALLAGVFALPGSADASNGGSVGQHMPDCKTSALEPSSGFDFAAARGKVLYVDFWASWCVPCAKAFPFLNALHQDYAEQGLLVVGISVDEKLEDANDFIRKHPVQFITVSDTTGSCPKAFAVAGMPSSYLVDRQGIIHHVHTGFRDSDIAQRRQQIEQLLAAP